MEQEPQNQHQEEFQDNHQFLEHLLLLHLQVVEEVQDLLQVQTQVYQVVQAVEQVIVIQQEEGLEHQEKEIMEDQREYQILNMDVMVVVVENLL